MKFLSFLFFYTSLVASDSLDLSSISSEDTFEMRSLKTSIFEIPEYIIPPKDKVIGIIHNNLCRTAHIFLELETDYRKIFLKRKIGAAKSFYLLLSDVSYNADENISENLIYLHELNLRKNNVVYTFPIGECLYSDGCYLDLNEIWRFDIDFRGIEFDKKFLPGSLRNSV